MVTHTLVRDEPDWPTFRAVLEAREASRCTAFALWRGASYTFGEVARGARAVAAFLRGRGLGAGDTIVIVGENSPAWMIAYFGARLLNVTAVPLDCQLGASRIAGIAAFAGARRAFADGPRAAELAAAGVALDVLPLDATAPAFASIFGGEPLPWADLPTVLPDDLATIIFTSGTTDDPKGVELTERNLLGNAQTLARLGIVSEADTVGVVLPLHHAYAFTVGTMVPFVLGGRIVFPGTLKGDLIRQCLAETGVTVLPAVPLLLELMADGIRRQLRSSPLPARLYARAALALGRAGRALGLPLVGRAAARPIRRKIGPSLRLIVSAGAALPADVNRFFLDLGFQVVEGYGLTETSPAVAITPLERPRPGSVGFPLPGAEIELGPPREDGAAEILVRGPMVMRGYHKRPDLTREAFAGDFFRTGDLGRFDADGYLWITGRVKEVIVLPSGKNVYPEEVERHYLAAASIEEICVLEDPGKRECLHAVIVPREETARRSGDALAASVQFDVETLSKSLPTYQRIGGFTLTAEKLPRTRLGKLRRGEVAKLLPALRRGATARGALAADEERLAASPVGAAVLAVLADMAGRPVHPREHLELDCNLDSLRRLEALVRIENALEIEIDPERVADVARPIDLIAAISEGRVGRATAARFSWSELLRQEPSPPLEEIVPLRPGLATRAVRAFAWCLLRSYYGLRFGLQVRGVEHLPAGPCIVSPNHLSLIDAPVMYVALPRAVRARMCFFGARVQFESWFRRRLIKLARVIVVDQQAMARLSLQYGAAALRRGLSLCIFPEGRRSATGELEPGKPGTGLLARELGVPVVPALIQGTQVVGSRFDPVERPRGIQVTFGPPIPPEAFRSAAREEDLGKPWDEAVRALKAAMP